MESDGYGGGGGGKLIISAAFLILAWLPFLLSHHFLFAPFVHFHHSLSPHFLLRPSASLNLCGNKQISRDQSRNGVVFKSGTFFGVRTQDLARLCLFMGTFSEVTSASRPRSRARVSSLRESCAALCHVAGAEQRVRECACHCSKGGGGRRRS